MSEIIKYENISEYNAFMHSETLHPLVSVIDFSKVPPISPPKGHSFGFYTVFLKEVHCGDIKYGRNYYDYQEGTLFFVAPGQVISIEQRTQPHQPKGWGLIFHPDLLRGTSLGHNMKDYSFFLMR